MIITVIYYQMHFAFKSPNAVIVCKDLARFLFSVLRHRLYTEKKFIQFMHRLYENHKARLHSVSFTKIIKPASSSSPHWAAVLF